MSRKATCCYGCYAHIGGFQDYCNLGHPTETYEVNVNGMSMRMLRPKECCHKPKTVKEYFKRLNERIERNNSARD